MLGGQFAAEAVGLPPLDERPELPEPSGAFMTNTHSISCSLPCSARLQDSPYTLKADVVPSCQRGSSLSDQVLLDHGLLVTSCQSITDPSG